MGAPEIPSTICVHDDHWYLGLTIQSFLPAGPVTVFVSRCAWDGSVGDYETTVKVAEDEGAEVVLGDWSSESEHRTAALNEMAARGHGLIFIPDSDEVITPELLASCQALAVTDAADLVRVAMDTYWKSADYLIRPREELMPILMLNAQRCRHRHIREYDGPRWLTLSPGHGVMHHLSYAGPDERIRRKVETWGHRDEVLGGWWEAKWKLWDERRDLQHLHPTHPAVYGFAERTPRPPGLLGAPELVPAAIDPPVPENWPTVSIVIPLYGGPHLIFLCLDALAASQDLIHEVIVYDDVSPDDAADVAAKFPWVNLIRGTENKGFAGASNAGYEATTGEVVIFLNSDAILPRAGLIRLIETLMTSGSVAAAGPKSCGAGYEQGQPRGVTHFQSIPDFARDFAYRKVEDRDVPLLTGFCLAIRRSVLQEVGLFDETYKTGFFEDNDLCYRIQKAGYRLRITERSYVYHHGCATISQAVANPYSLLHENGRQFAWRNWEDILLGYASHLPGDSPEPITFRPDRSPDQVRRSLLRHPAREVIDLSMIVRDEERNIENCLRSAQGYFREMVVVDTGSQDRTIELAEACGARVIRSTWKDSFAEARNESLAATVAPWVFWMDADDVLPLATVEKVLDAALHAPPDVVGFVMCVQFTDHHPREGTRVDHVKLFRNLPDLTWEGRIHEQILPALRATGGRIERLDAAVWHAGYDTSPEGQAKKRARDFHLLELELAERPDHPFVNFNMGMTLHHVGRHEESLFYLEQSIRLAGPQESHLRKSYSLWANALLALQRPGDAHAVLDAGLRLVPDDPELRLLRAQIWVMAGEPERAHADLDQIHPVRDGFTSMDFGAILRQRDELRAHLRQTFALR